jgi:hypothetical protein
MNHLTQRIGKLVRTSLQRIFGHDYRPVSRRRGQRLVRLNVETLDARIVLSPVNTVVFGGPPAGLFPTTYHLANTGVLTRSDLLGTVQLDSMTAAFNVDPTGTDVWDLETNGHLWHQHQGNWILEDTATGDIRMAPNGTLYDLEVSGAVWRWQKGQWDTAPLARGVTRFETDANNDVWALQDGVLTEWNNVGASPTEIGHVVSFAVGGTTVAYQIGLGPLSANKSRLLVTDVKSNGDSLVANDGNTASVAAYGVTLDGSLWVASDNGNSGNPLPLAVARISPHPTSGYDVDPSQNPNSTIVRANGQPGESFQVSPDESTVAVVGNGMFSSYTLQGSPASWTETKLDPTSLAAGQYGVGNDNEIYEGRLAGGLSKFTSPTNTTSEAVASSAYQFVLGPNGQLSFVTMQGQYLWSNDANVQGRVVDNHVGQIGVSVTGRQYERESSGQLWVFDGVGWSLLSGHCSTFTLTSTGQLYEAEANGDLWRLTTSWELVGSGTQPGSLFTLADGTVIALEGFNLAEFTPDMTAVIQPAVSQVSSGYFAFIAAVPNERGFDYPIADPWEPGGTAFSVVLPVGNFITMSPALW